MRNLREKISKIICKPDLFEQFDQNGIIGMPKQKLFIMPFDMRKGETMPVA